MTKLFQIDVPVYATAYIRAESADQAREIALGLNGHAFSDYDCVDDNESPPDISFSSALTIQRLADDDLAAESDWDGDASPANPFGGPRYVTGDNAPGYLPEGDLRGPWNSWRDACADLGVMIEEEESTLEERQPDALAVALAEVEALCDKAPADGMADVTFAGRVFFIGKAESESEIDDDGRHAFQVVVTGPSGRDYLAAFYPVEVATAALAYGAAESKAATLRAEPGAGAVYVREVNAPDE